jgi:hypothetical protein
MGLFPGGAQRRAQVMRVSNNSCPSLLDSEVEIFAKPFL